jgi:transcription termination factor Rho
LPGTAPADGAAPRRATRPAGPPQSNAGTSDAPPTAAQEPGQESSAPAAEAAPAEGRSRADAEQRSGDDADRPSERRERTRSRAAATAETRNESDARADSETGREQTDADGGRSRRGQRDRSEQRDRSDRDGDQRDRNDRSDNRDRGDQRDRADQRDRNDRGDQRDRADRGDRGDNQRDGGRGRNDRDDRGDDDGEGGGRRRRGRYRDRNRKRGDRGGEGGEPVVTEDDVLIPVAGILDVLDNYAFVRTSGYLAGPNDVYVSMGQIRKHGLRRGDAITGAVRAARDTDSGSSSGSGNRRDKYNPLVRLDTINGMDPEEAKRRPEFYKLTPLYPQDRLRLETEPHNLTTRVIDLVTPIGKGQRALIVSPPKAGKTMVLQALANAITTNNPECHLMVVLVDERPEEVTDMQRSVKGEVIAATFDRPPSDHTTVAELAIERAKRLVEMGHDVVVLLDSVTRLGRSYNLAAPASGRILSGGIDSTALYPPKRFLGAARNIENGGSLTILATALVETGSTMDTVIFEEFKGTGNSELKLDRKIADRRVWPAVDVNASSTRKEEILLPPEELVIVHKLRRVLAGLEPQQALDLLLDRLKQNKTNTEFLMQIAKTTPGD